MRRTALVAALAAAWLVFPAGADAARVAVGLARGADARAVADAIERRTATKPESLKPIPALIVELPAGSVAEGNPRDPLCRASSHPSPRVHSERPAGVEAVVPRLQRLL